MVDTFGFGVGSAAGFLAHRVVIEALGFVVRFHDVAVMREPIEQRGGHLGIDEHAAPLAKTQVGLSRNPRPSHLGESRSLVTLPIPEPAHDAQQSSLQTSTPKSLALPRKSQTSIRNAGTEWRRRRPPRLRPGP